MYVWGGIDFGWRGGVYFGEFFQVGVSKQIFGWWGNPPPSSPVGKTLLIDTGPNLGKFSIQISSAMYVILKDKLLFLSDLLVLCCIYGMFLYVSAVFNNFQILSMIYRLSTEAHAISGLLLISYLICFL